MTTTTGSFGTALQGTLNSNTTDTIKLTASAAGAVSISFQHPAGPGTAGTAFRLQLVDFLGNVLVESIANGNIVLDATVPAAGDFYLKLIDPTSGGEAPGTYSVTAALSGKAGTVYDGGANNTTATAIAAGLDSPIVGSLTSNDADVFKLKATAGGVVTLDFTHPNGVGTSGNAIAIELTDAAGNIVVKTATSGNTVLTSTVVAAGDYYVKVSDGNSYEYGDGGLYTLTANVTGAAATTFDGAANNTTATAIATPMGTPLVGSLTASATDVFKLRADAGGVVKLDFVHPNGAGTDGNAVTIELSDAAGNVIIKTTTKGNTALSTTVAAAGDYFVKVLDGNTYDSGDGGIYKLTPSISTLLGVTYDGAANNSSATAIKAALPAVIMGSLNNADSDYFSFSTASGGMLSLSLAHPEGPGTSGESISITILDAKSGTVVAKTLSGNGLFTTSLPSAGDYTLKVSDGNSYSYDDAGIYTIVAGLAGNGGITLDGSAASERLAGSSGNDVINGAGGIDTVTYGGNAAGYKIAISAAGVSVVDTTGKDGFDTLFNVERLQFADQLVSLDVNGVAAQAYRVYQAAFDRAPDAAGLGYWIGNMEKGTSLAAVAQAFIGSPEFRDAYGANPANRDMVAKFYTNVLHRAPDQAGLDFWTGALDSGAVDAATVLAGFSESAENVAQLVGTLAQGIGYLPYA
jgi:hypothetical protein